MPSCIILGEARWERSARYTLRILCVQSWYQKQHEYKWYVGHPIERETERSFVTLQVQ